MADEKYAQSGSDRDDSTPASVDHSRRGSSAQQTPTHGAPKHSGMSRSRSPQPKPKSTADVAAKPAPKEDDNTMVADGRKQVYALAVVNQLILLGLAICLVLTAVFTVRDQENIELVADTKNLAQELRQSSDDLTRFIRTYTVTGNASYWAFYNDVIDIRNGDAPLPEHPWRNYWDLFISDGVPPRGFLPPAALLDRMVAAGFTADEMVKLEEAAGQSDALIDLEVVASNAMVGRYRPSNTAGLTPAQANAFSVLAAPNQTLAAELVHSVPYHLWKGRIMRPLDEFAALSTQRLVDRVAASYRAKIAAVAVLGVMLLLLIVSQIASLITTRSLLTNVERLAKEATAGADCAARVATRLQRYDTVGVRAALTAYESQAGVNKRLARSLRNLNENLEKYKPHLPAWVLPNDDDVERDSAPGSAMSISGDKVLRKGSRGAVYMTEEEEMEAEAAYNGSMSGHTDEEDHSIVATSQLPGMADSGHSVSSVTVRRHHRNIAIAVLDFRVLKAAEQQARGSLSSSLPGFTGGFMEDAPARSPEPDKKRRHRAKVDSITGVVDVAHRVAKETGGAVHSFIGSQLVLTWNAARLIQGAPEKHAAKGALRVCKEAKELGYAEVCGAVMAGNALVHVAGSGQQALLIDIAWRHSLRRLGEYARYFQTVVADGASHHACVLEVDSRAVALLPDRSLETHDVEARLMRPGHTSSGHMQVFELLSERKMDENEWMYQLQQLETKATVHDDSAVVTGALKAATQGNVEDALHRLRTDVESAAVKAAPTVAFLQATLEGIEQGSDMVSADDVAARFADALGMSRFPAAVAEGSLCEDVPAMRKSQVK